jgi:hypothetical protein
MFHTVEDTEDQMAIILSAIAGRSAESEGKGPHVPARNDFNSVNRRWKMKMSRAIGIQTSADYTQNGRHSAL